MRRKYVADASISIDAPCSKVWEALVDRDTAKKYFFGAEITTTWEVGSPIVFSGEFNGNHYCEKGTILQCVPEKILQYNHWSDLEDLPDVPENYRNWTFSLFESEAGTTLTVSEDNIPDETKQARSNEFWPGILSTIKRIVESDC
jgi:uncharacterized protein YndB with AHSA1/START domain